MDAFKNVAEYSFDNVKSIGSNFVDIVKVAHASNSKVRIVAKGNELLTNKGFGEYADEFVVNYNDEYSLPIYTFLEHKPRRSGILWDGIKDLEDEKRRVVAERSKR